MVLPAAAAAGAGARTLGAQAATSGAKKPSLLGLKARSARNRAILGNRPPPRAQGKDDEEVPKSEIHYRINAIDEIILQTLAAIADGLTTIPLLSWLTQPVAHIMLGLGFWMLGGVSPFAPRLKAGEDEGTSKYVRKKMQEKLAKLRAKQLTARAAGTPENPMDRRVRVFILKMIPLLNMVPWNSLATHQIIKALRDEDEMEATKRYFEKKYRDEELAALRYRAAQEQGQEESVDGISTIEGGTDVMDEGGVADIDAQRGVSGGGIGAGIDSIGNYGAGIDGIAGPDEYRRMRLEEGGAGVLGKEGGALGARGGGGASGSLAGSFARGENAGSIVGRGLKTTEGGQRSKLQSLRDAQGQFARRPQASVDELAGTPGQYRGGASPQNQEVSSSKRGEGALGGDAIGSQARPFWQTQSGSAPQGQATPTRAQPQIGQGSTPGIASPGVAPGIASPGGSKLGQGESALGLQELLRRETAAQATQSGTGGGGPGGDDTKFYNEDRDTEQAAGGTLSGVSGNKSDLGGDGVGKFYNREQETQQPGASTAPGRPFYTDGKGANELQMIDGQQAQRVPFYKGGATDASSVTGAPTRELGQVLAENPDIARELQAFVDSARREQAADAEAAMAGLLANLQRAGGIGRGANLNRLAQQAVDHIEKRRTAREPLDLKDIMKILEDLAKERAAEEGLTIESIELKKTA